MFDGNHLKLPPNAFIAQFSNPKVAWRCGLVVDVLYPFAEPVAPLPSVAASFALAVSDRVAPATMVRARSMTIGELADGANPPMKSSCKTTRSVAVRPATVRCVASTWLVVSATPAPG